MVTDTAPLPSARSSLLDDRPMPIKAVEIHLEAARDILRDAGSDASAALDEITAALTIVGMFTGAPLPIPSDELVKRLRAGKCVINGLQCQLINYELKGNAGREVLVLSVETPRENVPPPSDPNV